jgi:succinate dehydrogenase / fumarate reductase cytochrome b subunit
MSNFFTSSLGKKLIMSLAGLFLCVFLVVHLGINLLLMSPDKGEAFRTGVEFMTTNIVVRIMEFVLFGGFLLHIIYGVIIQIRNWFARPSRYALSNNSQTSFFSKYMIHTGVIIFIFLVIHLANFYFVKLGWVSIPKGGIPIKDAHDFYNMAINLFQTPGYSIFYILCMVFLSFHLMHAFWSAFQTMGVSNHKYSTIINRLGMLYAIVIPLGFAIIPVYFLFFYR